MTEKIRVGVVGVGNMGRHHARVYNELPGVELVGVTDVDEERAREVATRFDTRPRDRASLLAAADAVSIVVPTRHHASVGHEAVEAGTHILVEKPFVVDPAAGRELLDAAERAGLVVGVGHVERYNPAVEALDDVLADTEVLAVAARRQGPPVDRDSTDSVVFDLMIHDIDVALSLADAPLERVSAVRVPDHQHVVANLEFEDGLIATLTSSRISQRRVRDLSITAADCRVEVDYMDQSVDIHRHSLPEYVATNGDVRYRHESVIERPTVGTGEPLKNELSAFAEAVREGVPPRTSGEDGLLAVDVATRIEAALDPARDPVPQVTRA